MRSVGQVAHYHWPGKASQVPHRIDQSDGRSSGGLTQKQRGHCPKHGLKSIERSPRDHEQSDGQAKVGGAKNRKSESQSTHE